MGSISPLAVSEILLFWMSHCLLVAFYDHGSVWGGVGVVRSSDRKKVGFGLRQTQWNSGCTGSLPHPFGPSCLLCKMAMVAACRVRVQDPQMGSRQTCHCRPLGRSSLHLPAGEPDNRKHVVGHPQHSYLWFPFLLTQCVRLLWRRGPTWLSGWSWLCVSASRNTPQSLRNLISWMMLESVKGKWGLRGGIFT